MPGSDMIELFGVELGSIFQMLAALFSGGLFISMLTFINKWRSASISAEALLRTHFSDQLKSLEARWTEGEERHKQCLNDRDELRKRVRELEDHLEGVYRMLVQTSAEKVIELSDSFPPHIVKLAQRTVAYSRAGKKDH